MDDDELARTLFGVVALTGVAVAVKEVERSDEACDACACATGGAGGGEAPLVVV